MLTSPTTCNAPFGVAHAFVRACPFEKRLARPQRGALAPASIRYVAAASADSERVGRVPFLQQAARCMATSSLASGLLVGSVNVDVARAASTYDGQSAQWETLVRGSPPTHLEAPSLPSALYCWSQLWVTGSIFDLGQPNSPICWSAVLSRHVRGRCAAAHAQGNEVYTGLAVQTLPLDVLQSSLTKARCAPADSPCPAAQQMSVPERRMVRGALQLPCRSDRSVHITRDHSSPESTESALCPSPASRCALTVSALQRGAGVPAQQPRAQQQAECSAQLQRGWPEAPLR